MILYVIAKPFYHMLIIVRYLNLFQFWIQLFPGKRHSSSAKKMSYKNEQTPDTLMFTAGVLLDVIPQDHVRSITGPPAKFRVLNNDFLWIVPLTNPIMLLLIVF
jgi:hypothetical protein